MYLKKDLLCVAVTTVFISIIISVRGNCTLFECSSTLNQSACAEKGEYLEINTTISCCPTCRKGLRKLRLKMLAK